MQQFMMRKYVLWVALAATIWLTWLTSQQDDDLAAVDTVLVANRQANIKSIANSHPDAVSQVSENLHLKPRTKDMQPYFNLFAMPANSQQPPVTVDEVTPVLPVAPALPFKYMGMVMQSDQPQVILEDGDEVLAVKVGDHLGVNYKLVSINRVPNNIEILYIPMNIIQTLAVRNESEL